MTPNSNLIVANGTPNTYIFAKLLTHPCYQYKQVTTSTFKTITNAVALSLEAHQFL